MRNKGENTTRATDAIKKSTIRLMLRSTSFMPSAMKRSSALKSICCAMDKLEFYSFC